MFIQFHGLTQYTSALLNRREDGEPKRMPVGGVTRTRVSSQSLKYSWRNDDRFQEIPVEMSVRSRETFPKMIAAPLHDSVEESEAAQAFSEVAGGEARDIAKRIVSAAVMEVRTWVVSGSSATPSDLRDLLDMEPDEGLEELKTGQVVVLGRPEVRYLREVAQEVAVKGLAEAARTAEEDEDGAIDINAVVKVIRDQVGEDLGENLAALEKAAGLDAALFGRMATSDILAQGRPAISVAHSLTTHGEEYQREYFSAVDQLQAAKTEAVASAEQEGRGFRPGGEENEKGGAAHVGETALTSGLFYSYVSVDVPLLVSNLSGTSKEDWQTGDRELAAEVVATLLEVMAQKSPGAKKGGTAPYAYAQFMMGEATRQQPRQAMSAFEEPAPRRAAYRNSVAALDEWIREMDRMHGFEGERVVAKRDDDEMDMDHERMTIPQMKTWAKEIVTSGLST